MNVLTLQNALAVMGIAGGVFAVYNYFRQPDIDARQTDALLDQRLRSIEKTLSNDLPHIDQQIKQINLDVASVKNDVVRLATIIEERIPRRK